MNSVARVDDDDSPNLRVLLARHDCQVSPTLFQLQRLRIALDVECLECSRIREDVDGLGERERQMTAPIEPDLIAPLIRHLSSSLNHSSYPGAARYREYQLRTLVSALALLHHRGVTALDADLYNGLYENIADRFRDLVCEGSRRGSSPSKVDACRHASALYLIRLALQYASLFNRREPKALQMAAPLTNLLLAGASVVRSKSFLLLLLSLHVVCSCHDSRECWHSRITCSQTLGGTSVRPGWNCTAMF